MADVTISINGRNYDISCDKGQESHVADLASYVDQRLRQVASSGAAYNDAHLLVITSLLLADELYEFAAESRPDFSDTYLRRLAELEDTNGADARSTSRKEQGVLRALLFGDAHEKQCALCHRTLPTDLMVTAHIKPRSRCSLTERKDPSVVMPVCKVGCDDLFEKGYLIVDSAGAIRSNKNQSVVAQDLKDLLDMYVGKNCLSFSEPTAKYFEYKRGMVMDS